MVEWNYPLLDIGSDVQWVIPLQNNCHMLLVMPSHIVAANGSAQYCNQDSSYRTVSAVLGPHPAHPRVLSAVMTARKRERGTLHNQQINADTKQRQSNCSVS
jgi:hypothetical protein